MSKIDELKKLLRINNIDGYLIFKNDIFFSEEILPCDDRLNFITNFSGSYGISLIISKKNYKSVLFSDGRYELQIEQEVDKKIFNFIKGDFFSLIKFINKNRNIIKTLSFDDKLISIQQYKELKDKLLPSIKIKYVRYNLVDKVWNEKQNIKPHNVYNLPIKYSGKTSKNKIKELTNKINQLDSYGLISFRPDCISWLLNFRDDQLTYSPVFRAVLLINKFGKVSIFTQEKVKDQFIRENKRFNFLLIKNLNEELKNYNNKNIIIDPLSTPLSILKIFKKNNIVNKEMDCVISNFKVIKNKVEQNNAKIIHLFDGLSFLKFWYWLDSLSNIESVDEEILSNQLYKFRSECHSFKSNSFPTICGFGKNGSIIHYRFKRNNSSNLKKNNILLIDSGGQYYEGTTDLTRTIGIGQIKQEITDYYTMVLKGHLAISNLSFPKNTKGFQIDSIARMFLWQKSVDYDHGTGHGVGSFLNVHEGPISISKINQTILKQGMIISNEPGFYKKNKFGIRIENLELVSKKNAKLNINEFLFFNTLTMVPYDKNLINKKLLSKQEIKQINNYHKKVRINLERLLDKKDKELKNFLKLKTKKL